MTSNEKIDWIIRPTTSKDADSIDALLKVCYETLLPNDYDANLLEKALPLISEARPELLTCGTWYLVQHPETGMVVGCGGWADSPTGTTETNVHLRHFATHPDYVRMGIAKGIWDCIRADIIARLGPDTDLEVYSTLTAQLFYESLGFVRIATVHLPLRSDCNFPSVLMRRSGKSLEL